MARSLVPIQPAVLLVSVLCCLVCGCDKGNPSFIAVEQNLLDAKGRALPAKGEPGFPSVFTARVTGRNRISLRWTDVFKNERGYVIERSEGKGNAFAEIARVDAGSSSFEDTRLKPSTIYTYRVRAYNSSGNSPCSGSCSVTTSPLSGPIIIDHTCADPDAVPVYWVKEAKNVLHIAYGHTSYGSQLITGMSGLAVFKGNLYAFQSNASGGEALDLRDEPFDGARDLGNPDRKAWAAATKAYLDEYPEVNVVIWSWGGQADASGKDIDLYLSLMESLEKEYPSVVFVYMTGHVNGTGLKGNLHLRNEQIRDFCRSKGKVLYDFEDIESYDPDGGHYGNKQVNAGCEYDSDMDGSRDANWAIEWQDTHTEGQEWYECYSAHSQSLNANLKAYAAWWLWARLAGWEAE